MKRFLAVLAVAAALLPRATSARDDRLKFSIADALAQPAAKEKLDTGIRFAFGSQRHPAVERTIRETVVNLKTNAFGKSDLTACNWVFLSVLIELQKQAREAGGDAIVGLESYYKKETFVSDSQFMCGAGATIAGVALKGQIVKLAPEGAAAKPAEAPAAMPAPAATPTPPAAPAASEAPAAPAKP